MMNGSGARLLAAALATALAAGGEMQAPAGTDHDCSRDASLPGIFAQRFDASGMRKGAEFRVDAAATSYQDFPSVAMDAAGNFVVTWETFGQDGRQTGVLGQRFDASGTRSGAEFHLDAPATDQDLPTVAVDAAGNFVVTWDFDQDGSGAGIYGQLFDASGMPRGAQFRVNTSTTGSQDFPSVAVDAAGDFVVAWHSSGQDGSLPRIPGQRSDAQGALPGGESCVSVFTTGPSPR